jgi:hypothetical protein
MDSREARFILSAYRPEGQDASDPRMAGALEQVRCDPILQRWFDDAVVFDATVTETLRAISPPNELRESILTGLKVSRASLWPRRLGKWTIAAALILTASLGWLIWHQTRPAHLADWQKQALEVVSSLVRNESSFDAQSNRPADLVAWLHANRLPAPQTLPQNLAKLESLGCKTFSRNGTLVSIICFTRPDGGLIHLVTTSAPAPARSRKSAPDVVQRGKWATATWRQDEEIHMLALEGSPEQLRSYLL